MTLAPSGRAPSRTSRSLETTTTGRSGGMVADQVDDDVVGQRAAAEAHAHRAGALAARGGGVVRTVEHDLGRRPGADGQARRGPGRAGCAAASRSASGQAALATLYPSTRSTTAGRPSSQRAPSTESATTPPGRVRAARAAARAPRPARPARAVPRRGSRPPTWPASPRALEPVGGRPGGGHVHRPLARDQGRRTSLELGPGLGQLAPGLGQLVLTRLPGPLRLGHPVVPVDSFCSRSSARRSAAGAPPRPVGARGGGRSAPRSRPRPPPAGGPARPRRWPACAPTPPVAAGGPAAGARPPGCSWPRSRSLGHGRTRSSQPGGRLRASQPAALMLSGGVAARTRRRNPSSVSSTRRTAARAGPVSFWKRRYGTSSLGAASRGGLLPLAGLVERPLERRADDSRVDGTGQLASSRLLRGDGLDVRRRCRTSGRRRPRPLLEDLLVLHRELAAHRVVVERPGPPGRRSRRSGSGCRTRCSGSGSVTAQPYRWPPCLP